MSKELQIRETIYVCEFDKCEIKLEKPILKYCEEHCELLGHTFIITYIDNSFNFTYICKNCEKTKTENNKTEFIKLAREKYLNAKIIQMKGGK
jgi:hypothetical protein